MRGGNASFYFQMWGQVTIRPYKNMFLLILLFLLSPLTASADSGHIVISEIQTYGQSAKDEFVRLYNPTASAVNISGWKLTKKTASGNESNLVSKFADGTSVPANSGFLITHKTDYKGTETADSAYSGSSYSIADNNTAILKDAGGAIIDKVGFGTASDYEGAPTDNPEKGESIKRQNNQDTDNNKNDFNESQPTPEQSQPAAQPLPPAPPPPAESQDSEIITIPKNDIQTPTSTPTPTPTSTSTSTPPANNQPLSPLPQQIVSAAPQTNLQDIEEYIIISEILPNPEGSDMENEWIEIYNGSNQDINLGGLFLDDDEGGSKAYKIPQNTIIKTNDYLLFLRTKTNLALNNSDDSVRILDFKKEEIKSVKYEGAKEGYSYAYKNDKWNWTNAPTPLKENTINLPLLTSPSKGGGGTGSATGIVVVPPNLFSTRTMYINGLQLYMHYADWPDLKIGDKIKVYGTPSTYYNEPRLKLKNKNSITLISQNNTAAPEEITGDDIDDEYVGKLIIIEGEVIEKTSTKLYLDADGAEITIYNKTNLKFSDFKEKDLIKVAGVLSKYNNTYRILPRDKDDLEIVKQAEIKTANPLDEKPPFWQYIISTFAVGAVAGSVLYIRRRKNGNSTQGSAE